MLSSIKTGRRRVIRLDELSFEVRLERRTTKYNSSRPVNRLVPVFILETHNQTGYKCLPNFVQMGNASLVKKTAIECTNEKMKGQEATISLTLF